MRTNRINKMISISFVLITAVGCAILVGCTPTTHNIKIANKDMSAVASAEEGVENPYASTDNLMPIDLSFSEDDVFSLMAALKESNYLAVYRDNYVFIRVTKSSEIQISEDGEKWFLCDTESIAVEDFSQWLYQNDPNSGYSMNELQDRLSKGATVEYLALSNNNEIYFILDETGVQLELVQQKKEESVFLDGVRMVLTSEQLPYVFSESLLTSFYESLYMCEIIPKSEAEQACVDVINWLEDDSNEYTVIHDLK